MFRHFYNKYFNPRYRLALRDENGKSIYAGYCMNSVEGKTGKKGSKIRESIKALNEKKRNLKNNLLEVLKHPILENDQYYSLRKKIRMQQFLFWILVFAEFGLNYFTTLIFLNAKGLMFFIIRIVIALTVTTFAIISTEKFLEEAIPKRKDHKRSIPTMLLWFILLVGVEVAIYYFGLVRGQDFESGAVGNDIAKALVLISMLIPIVAGGVRWDLLNYMDVYKNRRTHDKLTKRINSIDTRLEILRERENTHFQQECGDYWHTLNVFCTHKNSYNLKNNIDRESLENHKFAKDIDKWKEEAEKRYRAAIKKTDFDLISSKLDNIENISDKKLN